MLLNEIMTWWPPAGKVLASYTDDDGYKIEIVGGVPEKDRKIWGIERFGVMYITNPKGVKVKAGYWMNWPEKEWKISRKVWDEMPWEERAKLEVKQQATAYKSLADQFKIHQEHPH